MKMKMRTLRIACLAAACAFSLAPRGWTDDAGARVKDGQGALRIQTDASAPADYSSADAASENTPEARGESPVPDVYKASGLIGKEVKNRQGDTLGQIKDVVIDLESGTVSYVVLSTGGFLGVGDKMVAVPPGAFEIMEIQDGIVLNTDRESLRNARGLARNDWPDVRNPSWGAAARYDRSGIGGPAVRAESGTGSEQSDDPRSRVFRGKIESVHPESGTVIVRGEEGTRAFRLDDKPVLVLGDNRNPQLADFKTGYAVEVGYGKKGKDVAHRLQRTDVGAGQVK